MKKLLLLFFLMTISLGYSQDPATGPTNPSARNAWDVKSLYGVTYTNEPSVVFDTFGDGAASIADVTLGDANVVAKYLGHRYSGIRAGAGDLNVTTMTKLHIDVYSPDASFVSSFRVKLEAVNGSNVESDAPASPTRTTGNWISYDIDLSGYSAVDLAHLKWVVPVTTATWPTGITMYIDNVYFWRPATSLPPPTITAFSIPTKTNGSAPFTITAPTSTSGGAFTYSSSNTNVATISGSTITITGIGITTITANQAATGSFGAGSTTTTFAVTPPAAPAPTASAANVIPIYTDAYPLVEPATVDTFRAGWSVASLTPIVIPPANNTLFYTNVNYLGIETIASPINATAMNIFHIDVYTPNMTTFRVKLVDFGADSAYGGGDDKEHELSLTPTLNGWNKYNLLLSDFTGLTSRAHIAQIVLSGNPAGSGTMYIDNIYFAFETTTILSNFTIPAKVTSDPDFAITAPTSTSPGTFSYTSSNTAVATIVGGSSIHIVGIGTSTITATQAASGSYASATISSSFVVTAPIAQVPTTAAPSPPARNAWDVVSVFTDAPNYNVQGTDFFPYWGQPAGYIAPSIVPIASNNTLLYQNLTYQGLQFDTPINVLAMTKLHLDVYTPDSSTLDVVLIGNGENGVIINPTIGSWFSIDINVSNYSGRSLNSIIQMMFRGTTPSGGKVYVDNIYYWRPATSNPSPTLSNFTVPTKLIGAPAFTLTAPTSNSTGAFTYSSSNTAVATISGSTVTVVGAGTSVITATQAATGSYSSGVIAANFVVSFPPPTNAAPTPTVPADRVLSIFSDAYTTEGSPYYPAWGQNPPVTVSQLPIATNNTLKIDNLSYQGVQLTSVDVSAMTTMHVDLWTPNCTTFEVFLINQALPAGQVGFSGEQSVSLSPTQSGWNSFDIPMSSYSGLELNHIEQLKFVGSPTGGVVYLDNVYFTKPTPRSIAPTVADVSYCKGAVATALTATGFAGNALKWYTVGGTTLLPTYTLIAAGAPTPLTSTVGTKKYAVSQMLSNGVESAKATITVTIIALPTEVLGTITSNTTSATTTTGFAAATTAVGQYVGTTTPVTYRVPAFVDTTLTYYWTVPTGVNIVSQTANTLTVNFFNVPSGIGAVGSITVQAQNASGCRTAAKSVALTKALPAEPSTLTMNNGVTTTAITSFAKFMGTNTVLKLNAATVATATSYDWELPTGVTRTDGSGTNSTTPYIYVKFLGVNTSNTFSYTAASGALTYVLRFGVKSKNGVGVSTTSNGALINPTTTSTAKQLTLTAVKPAAVTAVAGQVAGLCGGSTYTYTITDTALASSYTVAAPSGAVVNFTSTLTFTVNYPVGFVINTTTSVPNKSLVITSVNGVGSSATTKSLTLSTAMAAIGTVTGGTTYSSCNQTFSVAAIAGASTYTWTVPVGASIVSQSANSVVVNYGSLTGSQTLKVMATNSCGVSSAIKSVTLTAGSCPAPKQDFTNISLVNDIRLYPNPANELFNVELSSSSDSEMEMTIYNMNGSVVRTKNVQLTEGNNVINEDISSLASGIYFVRFNNPTNNETITKKLIKE